MKRFKAFKANYKDIIQLDGAFSATHINYGESPVFHGVDGKEIAKKSRKDSISEKDSLEDVIGSINTFDGTALDFKQDDRISLWKHYWLEYIDVFDILSCSMPKSVVTVYIGRQAIEIGFKYLLLKKTSKIEKTHDLGTLAKSLFKEYSIRLRYMKYIDSFCEYYCKYIEGGNAEYFRFPEYKKNKYFAGNRLSINWLSYNFSLVLLKLLHFSGLDKEDTRKTLPVHVADIISRIKRKRLLQ